jgi:UDP-3-O-[3-hydroxymyristoyl] glucosamine N-acyltransferase
MTTAIERGYANGQPRSSSQYIPKLADVSFARSETSVDPTATIGDGVILGRGVQVGPQVVLSDGVILGDGVTIGAGTFIGEGTRIGAETRIGPNVTIRELSTIGQRTWIESGVVIGSDGFGFATAPDGTQYKVPQMGVVEIGDDVVIASGTTIDRATMEVTFIGDRCQLGAYVMVGHNVHIGSDTIIGPGTGVCGSAEIGEGVRIGMRCGIIGSLFVPGFSQENSSKGISKTTSFCRAGFVFIRGYKKRIRNLKPAGLSGMAGGKQRGFFRLIRKSNSENITPYICTKIDSVSAEKISGKCKGLRKRHCEQLNLRRTSV